MRRGCGHQHTDHRQFSLLLCAHRERASCCCRRAADERDELAASHSITSSARCRNGSGIVRPSVFAVLRLTTSSNLADSWTGRSAGLAPLRIRSTYDAARQYVSAKSTPYDIKPPLLAKKRYG